MRNLFYNIVLTASLAIALLIAFGHPLANTIAAEPPAKVAEAPKPDPKIAELQGQVDKLTQQLNATQRTLQTIQQQRNQIATQLLDVTAEIELMKQEIAANKAKADAEKPPVPVETKK